MTTTERIVPSPNTLIKYDNPILVSKHEPKAGPSGVSLITRKEGMLYFLNQYPVLG